MRTTINNEAVLQDRQMLNLGALAAYIVGAVFIAFFGVIAYFAAPVIWEISVWVIGFWGRAAWWQYPWALIVSVLMVCAALAHGSIAVLLLLVWAGWFERFDWRLFVSLSEYNAATQNAPKAAPEADSDDTQDAEYWEIRNSIEAALALFNLDLADNFSAAAVQQKYRQLAKTAHPDKFPEGAAREAAADHMAEINAARDLLLKVANSDALS